MVSYVSPVFTGSATRLIAMIQQSANFGQQRRAEFGRYLRDLRKRRGLKQYQVAGDLHINLSDIEKGKRPVDDELLIQLARRYGEPLGEMLMNKYWPQLPLLSGIMEPTKLVTDLNKYFYPEEVEEVMDYIASLLRKRTAANRS